MESGALFLSKKKEPTKVEQFFYSGMMGSFPSWVSFNRLLNPNDFFFRKYLISLYNFRYVSLHFSITSSRLSSRTVVAHHFFPRLFLRAKSCARAKSQGSIVRLIEREKEREKRNGERERLIYTFIYSNGTEKVAIEKIEIEGTNARPRTTKPTVNERFRR